MPKKDMNFSRDMKAAIAGEMEFIRQIQARGATDVRKNDTKEYDVSFVLNGKPETAEIKEDLLAEKTGNVAIEYESRGKPSGISSTIASYWCYRIKGDYYLIRTEKLQHHLAIGNYRKVSGGDNNTSRLVLIPLYTFLSLTRPIFTNVPAYLLASQL